MDKICIFVKNIYLKIKDVLRIVGNEIENSFLTLFLSFILCILIKNQ